MTQKIAVFYSLVLINMAQDTHKWLAVVIKVMKFRVPLNAGHFLTRSCWGLKKDFTPPL
jgi:hypothetical protein